MLFVLSRSWPVEPWVFEFVGPRQCDNSYRFRAVTRSSTVPRSRAADWQAIR